MGQKKRNRIPSYIHDKGYNSETAKWRHTEGEVREGPEYRATMPFPCGIRRAESQRNFAFEVASEDFTLGFFSRALILSSKALRLRPQALAEEEGNME